MLSLIGILSMFNARHAVFDFQVFYMSSTPVISMTVFLRFFVEVISDSDLVILYSVCCQMYVVKLHLYGLVRIWRCLNAKVGE